MVRQPTALAARRWQFASGTVPGCGKPVGSGAGFDDAVTEAAAEGEAIEAG